jgi:hypothetical protein
LGNGLVYFRLHTLPADLPAPEAIHKQPCVLDLRYARADSAAAEVLGSWLKFHAAKHTPVFVLENGSTAPALLKILAARSAMNGVLVIGIAGQTFEPDIAVEESSSKERRAYDAFEHGAAVEALTVDNPDKQRNDEASLAHDRAAEATPDDDTGTADTDTRLPIKPTPPPIDAALQMAIHLQRGLQALKKL